MKHLLSLMMVSMCVGVGSGGAGPSPRVLVNGGAMMDGNVFKAATVSSMRAFYREARRVVLILHASHPEDRDRMEGRLQSAFRELHPEIEARSLHRFEANEAAARAFLREADAVFIGGGDTFMLLRVLHETGQLAVLRERVAAGVPVGGSSAGANVLGPVIGVTNDFPVTDVPTRAAIGGFPALINPHHPLSEAEVDFGGRDWKLRNYLRWNPSERILALGDAATAVLENGEVTVTLGQAWLYVSGEETRALRTGERVRELE